MDHFVFIDNAKRKYEVSVSVNKGSVECTVTPGMSTDNVCIGALKKKMEEMCASRLSDKSWSAKARLN
jgi:hypothetical protein